MNKKQINSITVLQTSLSAVRDQTIESITKAIDLAMDNIVEVSDDPKKDGEENFRKLDEMKQELKGELKTVFEKFDRKLNSL